MGQARPWTSGFSLLSRGPKRIRLTGFARRLQTGTSSVRQNADIFRLLSRKRLGPRPDFAWRGGRFAAGDAVVRVMVHAVGRWMSAFAGVNDSVDDGVKAAPNMIVRSRTKPRLTHRAPDTIMTLRKGKIDRRGGVRSSIRHNGQHNGQSTHVGTETSDAQ